MLLSYFFGKKEKGKNKEMNEERRKEVNKYAKLFHKCIKRNYVGAAVKMLRLVKEKKFLF